MRPHPLPLPVLVPLIVSLLSLAGCGNAVTAQVAGAIGVGIDPEGRVVAVVATCGHDLDEVTLAGGREGLAEDEPNPVLASGLVPAEPGALADVVLTPAAAAGAAGVPLRPDDLAGSTLYTLSAHSAQRDVEAEQVSFEADELASLPADRVVTGDGVVRSRDALREACDDAH